jgi:hypothetical protein
MQRDNYSIPSQVAGDVKYAHQKGYTIVGDRYVDPSTGFDTPSKNGAIPAFVDDFTSRELHPGLMDSVILSRRLRYFGRIL